MFWSGPCPEELRDQDIEGCMPLDAFRSSSWGAEMAAPLVSATTISLLFASLELISSFQCRRRLRRYSSSDFFGQCESLSLRSRC
jgi:hypothetical protein